MIYNFFLDRVAQRQLKVNNTYKILEKNKEFKTFIFDNKHRKNKINVKTIGQWAPLHVD